MKKVSKVLVLVLALTLVVGMFTNAFAWEKRKDSKDQLVVGVAWKTFQEERWVRELNVMKDICEEQGIEFIYQVSENDAMKQVSQVENMVAQGIDILIAQTNEKEALANAFRSASEAGVLVAYYESTQGETYADFAGGNDEYSIGMQITQAIGDMGLEGKVAYMYGDPAGGSGVYKFHDGMHDGMAGSPNVEVIGEQWATNWDPQIALSNSENWLAQYGDEIVAILCMNDGLAGGAIQALENADLAGKVLVCGQDCDLVAVQRIVAGTQYSTVLKSGNEYPTLFINAVLDYYMGVTTAADYENSEENCDGATIPFLKYDGIVITKDNVDAVIEAGVYTYEEVYGEAEATEEAE